MPVNKLPKQKPTSDPQPHVNMKRQTEGVAAQPQTDALGKEAWRDQELALTDAEWKHLRDATKVVDRDTFLSRFLSTSTALSHNPDAER